MAVVIQPWQILVSALVGWITNRQDAVIEYLQEETEFSNNSSVPNDFD